MTTDKGRSVSVTTLVLSVLLTASLVSTFGFAFLYLRGSPGGCPADC